MAVNGFPKIENISFEDTKRQYADTARYLSRNLFQRNLKNGEKRDRSWLLFSKSTNCVFCGPCLLFSVKECLFTTGFNDWKNGNSVVGSHENSLVHTTCLMELRTRGNTKMRVDYAVLQQLEEEKDYWRNVLTRVAATIKFLTVRGLPLRGSDEQIGSIRNGNFLGILELIAEFDPFLNEHLKR